MKPKSRTMILWLMFIVICSILSQCCMSFHLHVRVPILPSPPHSTTRRSIITSSLNLQKMERTDEEWRQILEPESYRVLREEGTEAPWTSPLNDVKDEGTFRCKGCGSPLFTTSTKYESGSGWPSFYAPIDGNAIDLKVDYKLIMPRTEVSCGVCSGHLGHIFDDGPQPTGKRYCLNGIAMDFVRDEDDPELALQVALRVDGGTETGGAVKVEQPLMAVLPGVAFDGLLAGLFLSSFVSRDGGNGLEMMAAGNFGVGEMAQLFPLGCAMFYAVSGLRKASSLLPPRES